MCGETEDLHFRRSYCQCYFRVDHKLPENHQRPDSSGDPLFQFQKRGINERQVSKHPSTLPPTKQRRGSTVGKAILVSGIIILVLGIGLTVSPQSFHEEGEFVLQSLGYPVGAFDLGVIPKNVEIRVDYDVEEDPNGLSQGRLFVILVNASEVFVIDGAWNDRSAKDLPYPHYTEFRFDNVDFDYYIYDGPSEEGSMSWLTLHESNYIVLVWLNEVGAATPSLEYFIGIDATWHPYFTYGIVLTIIGIVSACIGFAHGRYSS